MEDIRYSEEVRVDAIEARWGQSCIDNEEYRRWQKELNKLYTDILEAMNKGRVYGHFV